MGSSGSKPRKDEALVLCKERTQYIREAIDARFTLSAAHLSYMKSLCSIGPALRQFTESVLLSDPALSVSELDKSPAHSSIASPTHGESPLSPLVKPSAFRRRTTGSIDSAVTVDSVTLSNSVVNPVESDPSWDYFDSNMNQAKGLRQIKEKKVLPAENEEKEAVSVTEEVKGDLGEEVEREDESEFITHRAKEFLPSVKEIEQQFIRAAEAGDEMARMLETDKVRLTVSSVVLSGSSHILVLYMSCKNSMSMLC
jgi:Protein of unknown function (DUF630)/Protein of unknown function (DUF632)